MKYALQKSPPSMPHVSLPRLFPLDLRPSRITPHVSRIPDSHMLTYMLLGLVAGLLTGILIAWYRRQQ